MDFTIKETIFKRFNSAAYDIALAETAFRKSDLDSYVKHKRDAGEAISQSLEYALKNHLDRNLSSAEKRYFNPYKQDIARLIEKYIDKDGNDNGYLYSTVDDTIEPQVDFSFLLRNKNNITNAAKHEGKEPDIEVQKKYLQEVKKFIQEYIDDEIVLKSVEDYEKVDFSTWDLFYSACDRFSTEERNFILIVGPNQNIERNQLKTLSLPKWNLIIDFDYNSESNGLFDCAFKSNPITPHKIKASDLVDVNSFSRFSQTHYHYFANNFKGSGEIEQKEFSDWNRKWGKNTETILKSFAEVFSNQKNIVVIVFNSRRHINFLCEKIELYLGSNTSFVFANDNNGELTQVSSDFNGINVNISLPEIAEGLSNFSSNFGSANPNIGQILIPYMEKSITETTGILSPTEFAQLEEYFEVVHKGLPEIEEPEENRRKFLCGDGKISWFGLKYGFDVPRENFNKKSLRLVEKVIESGRGKITLVHDAGFGGSTVARRIAWEIHNDYPTLVLKKYKGDIVKSSIIKLHEKTRKTIFVVMEVPQAITLDEVDSLYKSIPNPRPVVFLVVKRGKPTSANELVVSDWGNDTFDLIRSYKPYLKEYEDEKIQVRKETELDSLVNSTDSRQKTPFYVGLVTFEEKFFALKDYIKNFVREVQEKEEQKRALTYLAICEDYLGQSLPSSFFKGLFKVKHQEVISLDNFLDSTIVDSLLSHENEGNHKFWKIRHNFFAKELKEQILSGSSANPEIWKQNLASTCVNFIEDSVSDSNTSDYIQEVLQKLFIGNRRDRAGEDFTAIIKNIELIDDKERVFVSLKNTYPENPHYCSHLARFYAYSHKNRDKALQFADEAIRLSEIEGNQDPLLYHIKGMCLRSIAYDEMEKLRKVKIQNSKVDDKEYIDVIEKLVPQAANYFEQSRAIAKRQNRLDEYGFVAHIQLLIKAIDFAVFISGKSKPDFFNQNAEPFTEWLDLAESLLEEVKRINLDDDESGKIEDCVNDILEFYENYELILQNLRNQLDKGKNPGRTRRQIVRTYFRKKEDYYRDARTVNNILNLMEQNIENEPDNEKNFYLWFQAARHSRVALDEALSKLAKWKANSSAIDAVFYFYILKVFRALQGYSDATVDAFNLIKECKSKGRSNVTIFEWCGKGTDLTKFVSRSSITPENRADKLELVEGYFTEFQHDGSGTITIADRLPVFFSPTQAKLTANDLNQPVEFYLGFSYDGLRADSYSVRIKGTQPRNTEPSELVKETLKKESKSKVRELTEKIQGPKVIDKIKLPETRNEKKTYSKRQTGRVIDMQKPPFYYMGLVETDFGKTYMFHKNNEKEDVFNQLSIGKKIAFDLKQTDKGIVAYNLEVLSE